MEDTVLDTEDSMVNKPVLRELCCMDTDIKQVGAQALSHTCGVINISAYVKSEEVY